MIKFPDRIQLILSLSYKDVEKRKMFHEPQAWDGAISAMAPAGLTARKLIPLDVGEAVFGTWGAKYANLKIGHCNLYYDL